MIAFNFSDFPVLETSRLVLRKMEPADDQAIFALRKDVTVNEFIERKIPVSIEEARDFMKMISNGIDEHKWLYWVIIQKDEQAFAGTIGLFNLDAASGSGEVGYELIPSAQRKGIMREALPFVLQYGFEKLKLNFIEAYSKIGNDRSATLLRDMDFERAGLDNDTQLEKYSLKATR